MKKDSIKNTNDITANVDAELNELTDKFNSMMKEILGRRTASTISKQTGIAVSTITRIRNGENKRGISGPILEKLWEHRDSNCTFGDFHKAAALNTALSNAYMKKENARWNQEHQEIDFLEKQIQKSMFNSGVFLRKANSAYEIIADEVLFTDMSYEVAFENGEKRLILFCTQFHSKRRIDQIKERKKEYPESYRLNCRHYRTILEFREMRALHPEYENSELVIVYNYEDDFRYNADVLKKLSNTDRVTLALMDSNSGRLVEEICLDGRKKGILTELDLI